MDDARAARRTYTTFAWKEADLRICCPRTDVIVARIKELRAELEAYIQRQPEFRTTFEPIELLPGAPEIAVRMERAAEPCGVGPMAAVAGAVAQMCVEAALEAGAPEAIVENGGDIFLKSPDPVDIGLYAGDHPLSGKLAFRVSSQMMPLSLCSSSSRFGHSLSLGDCDLATIVSADGCLADAAATLAGNSVKTVGDVEPALERIMAIEGIRGVLLIKADKVGMAGDLPPLVKCEDPRFPIKTFHR